MQQLLPPTMRSQIFGGEKERRIFTNALDEVHSLYGEMNKQLVTPDIDVVWALSTPGTVKEPASFPEGEKDNPYEGTMFNKGTIVRSVEIVLEVTALRLGKPVSGVTREDVALHGPTLYYNGESEQNPGTRFPQQNQHFLELSQQQDFPIPPEKVVICPIIEVNTPGQVKQLAEYLTGKLPDTRKVAVVHGVPHAARTGRYLEKYKGDFPESTTMVPFLVDQNEKGNQSRLAVLEAGKAAIYGAKGDLDARSSFFGEDGPQHPRPRIDLRGDLRQKGLLPKPR
ncbi:hypothetical protein IPO96_02030 [Candidatus Saccharibacteria bacterium]|nr:MAG: hypothetical protein IPO96_02030 [Candidatus Saccharibacteria bacterium]